MHKLLDPYPSPAPLDKNPTRGILQVLTLWLVGIVFSVLGLFYLNPWIENTFNDRTIQELIRLPLLSLPYLFLPLFLVVKPGRWTGKDLGLPLQVQSWGVTAFALGFGLGSGIIAFLNNQAVIGVEILPAGTLILLIFNNSFLEEFFHRGVILSKLERVIGQKRGILWGGVLFGLFHVLFDIHELAETGILFVGFALLLQMMGGWLLGIIFVKTRSLWPGIACHYLANWLPGILAGWIG